MPPERNRKYRSREITTGLVILLVAFSFMAALLLDFNFVSPYATLQEDLSYLSDHIVNQRISVYLWLGTALLILIAIPLFLATFHKRLRVLHYINGLLMVGASGSFLIMAVKGFELHQIMVQTLASGLDQTDEPSRILLLEKFREEQYYRYIGSSLIGLFAIGLGLTRIRIANFPVFATILLLLSGPVLVFYNWYDPDHLARTVAMAGVMLGVAIFSVRMINKGLSP
jgi:hypothetical protein